MTNIQKKSNYYRCVAEFTFPEWSLTCWDESRPQWRKIGLTSAMSSLPSSTSWSLPSPHPPQSPRHPPPPPPSPPPHRRHHSSVPSGLWLSRLRREWATVLSRIWNPAGSSRIWDPPPRIWTQSCEIFCATCHIFKYHCSLILQCVQVKDAALIFETKPKPC